jgi:hypothetical protein
MEARDVYGVVVEREGPYVRIDEASTMKLRAVRGRTGSW